MNLIINQILASGRLTGAPWVAYTHIHPSASNELIQVEKLTITKRT